MQMIKLPEEICLQITHLKIAEKLSGKQFKRLMIAIRKYASGKRVDTNQLPPLVKIIFDLMTQDIDKAQEAQRRRCEQNRINGQKGGAPKGNRNAAKLKEDEPSNNPNVPEKQPDGFLPCPSAPYPPMGQTPDAGINSSGCTTPPSFPIPRTFGT